MADELQVNDDPDETSAADLHGAAAPALILYHLFEDPYFFESWGEKGKVFMLIAKIIGMVINLLIIVSTVAFCFETMVQFSPDPHRNPGSFAYWDKVWTNVEITCVVLFTVDMIVRCAGAVAAGKTEAFFGDGMNWIDFLAIFPFYVKLVWADFLDLRFLRVIRLARILRSLKSAKYGSLGAVVVDIVKNSVGALFIPVYFMILALIVFSSLMFYVEKTSERRCELGDGTFVQPWTTSNKTKGNEGCATEYGCECVGTLSHVTYDNQYWSDEMYSSIPDSFWWCIVTFTTVGYGDKYPRTAFGRVLCAFTMFCGIFFLAMPLTIVGSSFSDAWENLQSKKLKAEAHQRQLPQEDGSDPLWQPDYAKVASMKADIKAHLLRAKALVEELRTDSVKEGGGQEVMTAWESNIEKLADADEDFDTVISLYNAALGIEDLSDENPAKGLDETDE
jgi:hypothetical protein